MFNRCLIDLFSVVYIFTQTVNIGENTGITLLMNLREIKEKIVYSRNFSLHLILYVLIFRFSQSNSIRPLITFNRFTAKFLPTLFGIVRNLKD